MSLFYFAPTRWAPDLIAVASWVFGVGISDEGDDLSFVITDPYDRIDNVYRYVCTCISIK